MKKDGDTVIVERGDSLASIAHQLGVSLAALLQHNPEAKNRIVQIGWPIKLPPNPDEIPNADEVKADDDVDEPGNELVVHVTGEEVADLVKQVQTFHDRLSELETSIGEIRKLAADGFEAHQGILKKFDDAMAGVKASIEETEARVRDLELAIVPAGQTTMTEPAPKTEPHG